MRIYTVSELSDGQIQKIAALMDACRKKDGFDPLPDLPDREDSYNDEVKVLAYENGMLIGYMNLFCPDMTSAEIRGFVHPDHRNRGIFSAMLKKCRVWACKMGAYSLFICSEHFSPEAIEVLNHYRCDHSYSEYLMAKDLRSATRENDTRLILRPRLPKLLMTCKCVFDSPTSTGLGSLAGTIPEDLLSEMVTTKEAFGYLWSNALSPEVGKKTKKSPDPDGCAFIVPMNSNEATLFNFGLLPASRGKGFAPRFLSSLEQHIHSNGIDFLSLEVNSRNIPACKTYQSCGYEVKEEIRYYRLPSPQNHFHGDKYHHDESSKRTASVDL